jgi:hypothetical protein
MSNVGMALTKIQYLHMKWVKQYVNINNGTLVTSVKWPVILCLCT